MESWSGGHGCGDRGLPHRTRARHRRHQHVLPGSQLDAPPPGRSQGPRRELSREPGFRGRFSREADIVAGLAHPDIVPVYNHGETDDGLALDRHAVRFAGAVTPERAIRIVIEIAEALDCPHSRGVGYQHVKPSDVLLSAVGEHVLLTGFGVVRTRGHIEVITDDSTSSALARRAPSLQGRAELRSWPVRGYGTAVRFDGDEAAHRAADASQGAYFRAELVARRVHLEDTIIKRRALIERRAYAANLRADVRSAEIEVGILSRLIAGLDRRFAAYWASDELAL